MSLVPVSFSYTPESPLVPFPVYHTWGCPLFAVEWSPHTGLVYLGGGVGRSGVGMSSGIFVCQPTDQWMLRQLGFMDAGDQRVDNMTYHTGTNQLVVGINGAMYKFEERFGRPLRLVSWVETDFDREEPQQKCCKFTRDGILFVTGGFDGCVRVWKDASMPILLRCLQGEHNEAIKSTEISSMMKTVVSCSNEPFCVIWDLNKVLDEKDNHESSHFVLTRLAALHPIKKKPVNFKFCCYIGSKLVTIGNVGSRGASIVHVWEKETILQHVSFFVLFCFT